MKNKRIAAIIAALTIAVAMAGCGKAASDTVAYNKSGADNNKSVAEMTEAYADDIDFAYEADAEADYDGGNTNPSGSTDVKVDLDKQMLVYRCSIALDTIDFQQTLTTLKTKIEEYHGFVERENQTDGNNTSGKYALDEDEKDYYYTATIRIPSEYYESFVSATEGIGILRSKNSSVDNVATRYGVLSNELEIYEAEYDRYLKQYEETEDESIALQIQSELRSLALTISDIKTEMSMLESDVAYSYVTITIHKVTQKELDEEAERIQDEEKEESFGTRLKDTAKESWKNFLAFLEGILLFVVESWWVLMILALIALVIYLPIRRASKKSKKIRKEQEEMARNAAEAKRQQYLAQQQKAAENNRKQVATDTIDKKESSDKKDDEKGTEVRSDANKEE